MFQAENLQENQLYEFRVRAINQAGLSELSVVNTAIECKEYTITVPGIAFTNLAMHLLQWLCSHPVSSNALPLV